MLFPDHVRTKSYGRPRPVVRARPDDRREAAKARDEAAPPDPPGNPGLTLLAGVLITEAFGA